MTDANRYNYAFDPDGDAWAARLLRQVPSGVDVLELGPGPGAMTRVLLDRGHRVTVVENDPGAMDALLRLGVEVLADDLNGQQWHERLRGRRFGAILACDVLEHLNGPDTTLQALRELAEPAAPLIISVPNMAYAGLIAGLQLGQFDYADTGLLDRTHVRFFTRSNLIKMLTTTGWAPQHSEGYQVPIEQSEFIWAWRQLGAEQRRALIAGTIDYDVYEWMMVASPMSHTVSARAAAVDRELARTKSDLHELIQTHDREHASLLEHQKAFSEARTTIADREAEIGRLLAAAAELRSAQQEQAAALAEKDRQLQATAGQRDWVEAQLADLRGQGWSGRVRRLLDALRK